MFDIHKIPPTQKCKHVHGQRTFEMLSQLGDRHIEGAEVGVGKGELSSVMLCNFPKLILHMVDSWNYKGDQWHSETLRATEPWKNRRRIMVSDSVDAAREFRDCSLDFVYMDAGHKYESVSADLVAWYRKIKHGGFLLCDDYYPPRHNGVVSAINEFLYSTPLKCERLEFENSTKGKTFGWVAFRNELTR